ncbi:MAG: helicase-related protein, partial [Nocardioides sp.]
TVIFTRTKHGAKALARQLNKNGVPSVDLHGNLSQNARTRNMDAFHSGEATALIATDIAARGIHVDDVALVIHADPPAEHKAYLHRSGRTARAGNEGTVVTLMTSDQVKDVRDLTKAAGIKPTTTRVNDVSHPILVSLAPGERTRPGGFEPVVTQPERRPAGEGTGTRKSRPGSRARKRQVGEGSAPAQGGRGGSAPKQGGQKAGTGNGGQARRSQGSSQGGQKSGGQSRSGGQGGRRGAGAGSSQGSSHSAASFSGRR